MANVKISDLTEDSSPATGDWVETEDVSANASKKVSFTNIFAAFTVKKLDKSLLTTDSNPYKFSAYRVAAQNVGTAATKITFDTEEFDTNSNFATGTYTIPSTAFYQINFTVTCTSAGTGTNLTVYLYKNGSPIWLQNVDANAGNSPGVTHSKLWSLTAADTLEVYAATSVAAKALDVATTYNNSFSGFYVSKT
jgi:hypothetical protein